MAFCTSCGKSIDPSARFCASCGTSTVGQAVTAGSGAAAQPAPVAVQPAPSGSSALKIILVIIVAVVILGIAGSIAATMIGLRIARNARVRASGDNATVSTPFGEIKSTNDPAEVAKELGIAVYPGAQAVRGAGAVNIPGLQVAGAEFVTDDGVDKVGDYYRRQFPDAKVDVKESNHQSIIAQTGKGMITINVQRQGDGTHIHIANLGGKPANAETE